MASASRVLQTFGVSAAILLFAGSGIAQGVRRLTLEEAQARAAGTQPRDLARLNADAARYHREAVRADYFPKIDSTFTNFHFNKFMGDTFQLLRRNVAVPLLNKDLTIVAFTVTQPVTPIFKVRQAVEIARADETIALAKFAQASTDTASAVEQTFFALLIAQRRQSSAAARFETNRSSLETARALLHANTDVIELTQSLNALLGFEPGTELDPVPPEPALQTISLAEATERALAADPSIVEAEQTVVKAKAATRLSKLEYVPDVAVIGGYAFQTAIESLQRDFSFIGVMATFNIFNFGKREKTVSERSTQLAMAETNLEIVKNSVAANVKKTFFDVERTRQIRDMTRNLAAAYPETPGVFSRSSITTNTASPDAEIDADMFQAELDYRLACLRLQRAMEGQDAHSGKP